MLLTLRAPLPCAHKQLPSHFFSAPSSGKAQLNPIASFFVRANMYALEKLSEGSFDQAEFLQGASMAYQNVMTKFAEGSTDGFEHMMTLRMKEGFESTLDEYKSQSLVLDYQIAPVDSADVIAIRFFSDEDGNDRVHVDVQFEGKQKFSLRDLSNRAVGEEGEWQEKASVWRFESPLPDISWELVDLP